MLEVKIPDGVLWKDSQELFSTGNMVMKLRDTGEIIGTENDDRGIIKILNDYCLHIFDSSPFKGRINSKSDKCNCGKSIRHICQICSNLQALNLWRTYTVQSNSNLR